MIHHLIRDGGLASLLIASPDSVRTLAEHGTEDDRMDALLQLARDPLMDSLSKDIIELIAGKIIDLKNPWDRLKAHYNQQQPEASLHAPYDEVLDERSREKEWHALEQADERQAWLDRYAAFYLLLLRHDLIWYSDAFRGILR
eukprot:1390985-Pleurochrysis_carterae.AAC.1